MHTLQSLHEQLQHQIEEAKIAPDDKLGRNARKNIAFITDCIRMKEAFDDTSLEDLRGRQAQWFQQHRDEFTEKMIINYKYQDRVLRYIIEEGTI